MWLLGPLGSVSCVVYAPRSVPAAHYAAFFVSSAYVAAGLQPVVRMFSEITSRCESGLKAAATRAECVSCLLVFKFRLLPALSCYKNPSGHSSLLVFA